jgi:hypothetical protein
MQVPSHKLAKHLNQKIQSMLNLLNTYNINNSKQIAQELINIQIKDHHRTVSLDIKDLYVNLPIENILKITKNTGVINKNTTTKS